MSKQSIGVKVWRCTDCVNLECMGTGAMSKCGQVDPNHTFQLMTAFPVAYAKALLRAAKLLGDASGYHEMNCACPICKVVDRVSAEEKKARAK